MKPMKREAFLQPEARKPEQQHILDLLQRELAKTERQLIAAQQRRRTESGPAYLKASATIEKLERLAGELAKARDLLVHHYTIQEKRRARR